LFIWALLFNFMDFKSLGGFRFKFALCLVGLVLAGCASTPYQRIGKAEGGYSSTRHTKDMYTVTFRGNEYSKDEQIYDYALLRSAELTKELGFAYFVVLSDADQSRTISRYHPGIAPVSYRTLSSGPNGSTYVRTTTTPGTIGGYSRTRAPVYSLRIKMTATAAEAEAPVSLIHEADRVVTDIKAKYRLK
jgi:hypothetical protein